MDLMDLKNTSDDQLLKWALLPIKIGYRYSLILFLSIIFSISICHPMNNWFINCWFIVKLIFEECKDDKFEFINRVKAIAAETKDRVQQRQLFE